MNNGWLDLVQILESMRYLHDDGSSFTLGNAFVLFQVKVQVVAITVLKDSAEGVGINLEDVIQTNNSRVFQLLVNVILS